MNFLPLVSVVVPTYNAGGYLRPAVESILKQTYQNFELIIVDDGSTDGSIQSLKDIADSRVKIHSQQNSGKSVAMNFAISIMNGKYMMLQDADDLSYPNRLECLVNHMEANPNLAMLFSGYDLIIGGQFRAPTFSELDTVAAKKLINDYKMPGHDPTMMIRTDVLKNNQYDESLRIAQGYDLVLRVGEQYESARLGACLYSYRANENSVTRKSVARRKNFVNSVLTKAHKRRGLAVPEHLLIELNEENVSFSQHESDNNLASHFIDSVIDSLRAKKRIQSLKIGIQCVELNPFHFHYYKALVYSVLPLPIVNFIKNDGAL